MFDSRIPRQSVGWLYRNFLVLPYFDSHDLYIERRTLKKRGHVHFIQPRDI